MKSIQIVEVGPRDGFQNIQTYIPKEIKIGIIEDILLSGIKEIQLTSFVSPKAIPQMKDAKEISEYILNKYPKDQYKFTALVPNLYGGKLAFQSGYETVEYVISLSESHNQSNTNKSRNKSFQELERMIQELPDLNIHVVVATAFGCPFEGKYHYTVLMDFIKSLEGLGIKEIILADTIGIGNPKEARIISKKCLEYFKNIQFTIHFHDTRNMGMASSLAAIESGIDKVQVSLGGLGGCPFAPGASGNTATEDLVYLLNEMGYDTQIDFQQILKAAKSQYQLIEGNYSSHHVKIT